jgi:hypothetical protein
VARRRHSIVGASFKTYVSSTLNFQGAEYGQMIKNYQEGKKGDKNVNIDAFKTFITKEINQDSDGEDQIRWLLKTLYPTDHFRDAFTQLDDTSQQRVKDFLYGESTLDIVRNTPSITPRARSVPSTSSLSSLLQSIKSFLMMCLGFRKASNLSITRDPSIIAVPVVSVLDASTPIIHEADGKPMEVHSGLPFAN